MNGIAHRVITLLALATLAGSTAVRAQERTAVRAQEPSPALAGRAVEKLAGLAAGGARGRVVLAQVELQSLVRYHLAGLLPEYIDDPRATMEAGRIRVSAQVPTERLATPSLSGMVSAMPATVRIAADGELVPLGSGYVAFEVLAIHAAGFSLAQRLIPPILERLGRQPRAGLAPNAVALPLPLGVSRLFVSGDSLVFVPAP